VNDDSLREAVRVEVERAVAVQRPRVARIVLYLGAVFVVRMAVHILGARFEPWIGAAVVGSTVW
jgi:hypothetical protein